MFYLPTKSLVLEIKSPFIQQHFYMIGLKLNNHISNFHPLEVVGRGSEAQLQVGENLIKLPGYVGLN